MADLTSGHHRGRRSASGATRLPGREPQPESGATARAALDARRLGQLAAQRAERRQRSSASREALDHALAFVRAHLPDYEYAGEFGEGGQGFVIKARHRTSDRMVAIKLTREAGPLEEQASRRFDREAEFLRTVAHANIVALHAYGTVAGRRYLVTEWVEGAPIDDFILTLESAPLAIAPMFALICRAVHHAHLHGVIHRDLKPSNILVDEQCVPRVCDFGLAKRLSAAAPSTHSSSLSLSGQVVGTLPYLSPEQVRAGDGPVDIRTDIYSLGVVLYQLLTDVLPYGPVESSFDLSRRIVESDPVPPRRASSIGGDADSIRLISDDLEAIILKALAKEPERRYQSALEMAADLERLVRGDAVMARQGQRAYQVRKWMRRHRGATAAAMAAVVTLTVSAGVVLHYWRKAVTERDIARSTAQVSCGIVEQLAEGADQLIRPLAGGTPVRREMLERLAKGLAELEPLVARDSASGPTYWRICGAQGEALVSLGRKSEAAGVLQGGIDRLLQESAGRDVQLLETLELSRLYLALADTLDDSRPALALAVDWAFIATFLDPDSEAAEHAYAHALVREASNERRRGDYPNAIRLLDRAFSLSRMEVAAAQSQRWQNLKCDGLELRGSALLSMSRNFEALATLQAAVSLRQGLLADRPADAAIRLDLVRSCSRMANLLRSATELPAAIAMAEEAIRIGEYLEAADPTAVEPKQHLMTAYDALASVHTVLGQWDAACAALDRSMAIGERWSTLTNGGVEPQRLAAYALRNYADILWKTQYPTRGLQYAEQAVAAWEEQLCLDPRNIAVMSALSEALNTRGACLGTLNREREAWASYLRGYDLRLQVSESDPKNLTYAFDVAESHLKLMVSCHRRRTPRGNADARLYAELGESQLRALCQGESLDNRTREMDALLEGKQNVLNVLDRRARRYGERPDMDAAQHARGRDRE